MRGAKTWVLVIDGVRARILRDVDTPSHKPQVELVCRAKSRHLRDFLTDRPGLSFSSASDGQRSAMEPSSDPIRRDMQDFADGIGDFLEAHRRAGDFSRLAVFADPKMLGIVSEEFPSILSSTVFLELPVNLISVPESELRARVLALIQKAA